MFSMYVSPDNTQTHNYIDNVNLKDKRVAKVTSDFKLLGYKNK